MNITALRTTRLALGLTVLDVDVGQGRNAIPLVQMGHRFIGIDLSSIGIEQLKKAAAS
jgi:tellurite methyltransferase